MPGTEVPITPSVLRWALEESGFTANEVAIRLGVSPETLAAWRAGSARPKLTEFKKLANILKRPTAALLLPQPPSDPVTGVDFRHPASAERQTLNATERRWLREIARVQDTLSWAMRQMSLEASPLPLFAATAPAEMAGQKFRRLLSVTVDAQQSWPSAFHAAREWRAALEGLGVLVFSLPLGEDSCRGFSLWNDYAPVVAINTWWNAEARTFSMLHECGHLVTRSNSACLESGRIRLASGQRDQLERWCERFAASVLLPWEDLRAVMVRNLGWAPGRRIRDLDQARALARHFRVSVTATVLRLIENEAADWALYDEIPRNFDQKKGGGGRGRNRVDKRRDEYGSRVIDLFLKAVNEEVVGRNDALEYLRVSDSDLEAYQAESDYYGG